MNKAVVHKEGFDGSPEEDEVGNEKSNAESSRYEHVDIALQTGSYEEPCCEREVIDEKLFGNLSDICFRHISRSLTASIKLDFIAWEGGGAECSFWIVERGIYICN